MIAATQARAVVWPAVSDAPPVVADQWPSLRLPDGRVLPIAHPARRLLAYLIDTALAFGVVALIETAVGLPVFVHELSNKQLSQRMLVGLPVTLVLIVAVMARTDGRTPGKALAGLRVVRVSGRRMDVPFALWREIAIKWLLFGSLLFLPAPWNTAGTGVLLLDVIWLSGYERRTLHDLISRSRVVDTRAGIAGSVASA
jgi:uncharacterized RDD family membrane protein YckC